MSVFVCVYSVVWLLYVSLTAVHLYANYRAVTAVTMDTFNQSRLHIVINHWLMTRQVLSLRQANQREPVFTGVKRYFTFHVGCSIQRLIDRFDTHYLLSLSHVILLTECSSTVHIPINIVLN